MKYVEVAVNAPGGHFQAFSYSVPPEWEIVVGQAVWAPFGARSFQGVVISVTDSPAYPQTRDIAELISPGALVSPQRMKLAEWIAGYYLSPLFNAVELMLPPGFKRKVITRISLVDADFPEGLEADYADFIDYIKGKGNSVLLPDLNKKFGAIRSAAYIKTLVGKGLVNRRFDIEKERIKPKLIDYIELNVPSEEAASLVEQLRENGASGQADIVDFIARQGGKLPVRALKSNKAIKPGQLKLLLGKGTLIKTKLGIARDPLADKVLPLELPLVFTDEQQSAWNKIDDILKVSVPESQSRVILLHGVTGSGKTELYLKALAETVRQGRKGIFLVPEIALTPQMIERFYSRFPGKVAVLHSRLTPGQQYDQWHGINRGEYDVVIGSRSAVFAPQPDLGLIIVDEEHEWAYKQSDTAPRFHTRDVALKLAELYRAVLILGSATPDVQTYYRGLASEFAVVELKSRAGQAAIPQLPEVNIVDMRGELKTGNRSIFSRSLQSAITAALHNEEQVILYINRRGQSTYIRCSECGHVMICSRCAVPLAFHSSTRKLICHHCEKSFSLPVACPECRSPRIKYFGAGTERVEDECARLFPAARVIRFDSDAVKGIKGYEKVVSVFKQRKADILVGTQMLAKGLDFPHVTLVGIINADIGLTLPDFRSAERTYQLLSQVSGRAGRGMLAGRSIIQTYNPAHYAIKYVATHDYAQFYAREIRYREDYGYPPFSQMLRMVYYHCSREKSWREAENMVNRINSLLLEKGVTDVRVIGPVPAHTARLRGRYLMQIVILGEEVNSLLRELRFPPGWVLDVDPVGVV